LILINSDGAVDMDQAGDEPSTQDRPAYTPIKGTRVATKPSISERAASPLFEEEHHSSRVVFWLSWLLGAAMLVAVIGVALRLSDVESFARLLVQAEPFWLLAAIGLQALTYVAQGQIFRVVLQAGNQHLSVWGAARLSLMKLFVDQALPSSGISGAFAVAASFVRKGFSKPVVLACLVLDLSAYFLAYVLTVGVALLVVMLQGHATIWVMGTGLVFVVISLALAIAAPRLTGNSSLALRMPGKKYAIVRKGLLLVTGADARLARSRPLLWRTTLLELAIIGLDAGTLWVLVRAFGVSAPPAGLFAGFMLASVLRSIGIVPGGLGAFEAAAVVTLHWVGVSIPVALSATLLFRGLTFWLPMVPGLWLAHLEWHAATARPRNDTEDH